MTSTFYKVLPANLTKEGHTFHLGLNQSSSGFRMCEQKDLHRNICYGTILAIATLPPEASVIVHSEYFLADFIVINSFISIERWMGWLDYNFSKTALQYNGLFLKYVETCANLAGVDVDPRLSKIAIEENPWAIAFCSKQTPFLCTLAVSRCGRVLPQIRNPTQDLERIAKDQIEMDELCSKLKKSGVN